MIPILFRMLFSFVEAWLMMILVGVIHAQVLPSVHTVRYGVALILVILIQFIWLFNGAQVVDD